MSRPRSMPPFNGGKMNHIFQPERGRYGPGFSSLAAQRCFEDPASVATLKVHGECCLLVKRPIALVEEEQELEVSNGEQQQQQQQFEWIFCTRLDTRGKPFPENHVPVPSTFFLPNGTEDNRSDDNDNAATENRKMLQPAIFDKHSYCFVPLPKDLVAGKGGKKTRPGPDTYGAIAAGVASGALPDPNDAAAPDFLTVEWVGRKHQGNMDCLTVDHAICVHGTTVVDIPERTREAVEEMARTVSIEGVVLEDELTGERFKLRFDMLTPDSLFAQNSKLKTSTPESTSIKPTVIVARKEEET